MPQGGFGQSWDYPLPVVMVAGQLGPGHTLEAIRRPWCRPRPPLALTGDGSYSRRGGSTREGIVR